MSLHQDNKLLLVNDKRCFVSHWPPASDIGLLLITNFLELRVAAGRRRTLAGRQHSVSGRPMLNSHIPCCSPDVTLPRPGRGLEKTLPESHIRGMAWERNGMCESNTAALCKSNGKDTISTFSGTAWQGNSRGTAWYV
jgi:hypothetical protein